MKEPIIINIQKYSVHDGDGIRITTFFRGYLLSCWWRHDPESQRCAPESMFNREKCNGCEYCRKACNHGAITIKEDGIAHTDTDKCAPCADCLDCCPHNNREIVGKQYSTEELMTIVNKDARFYGEGGGGITPLGGEVITQDIDYLEGLCRQPKDKGYDVAIDTCGYVPKENYVQLLPYVDTFLYNTKALSDGAHKKRMGKSNDVIPGNLEFLTDHRADADIRVLVVVPMNNDTDTILDTITYLKRRIGIVRMSPLLYHNTRGSKYEKLGRVYSTTNLDVSSQGHMEILKSLFEEHGFQQAKIGG